MCATRDNQDALADKAWAHLHDTFLNMSEIERHRQVMTGIPTRELKHLHRLLYTVSEAELHRCLGYTPPPTDRRPSRLPSQVSNVFLALLEVSGQAVQLFGSRQDAQHWLMKPLKKMDGIAPLELIRTYPGLETVKALMHQADNGFCA